MTVKPLRPVLASIAMMVISFVWLGCTGGAAPERKKMLNLTDGSSIGDCSFATADNATLPFVTAETSMLVNGVNTSMVSVAVPHAAYDSLALANVKSVLPFAYPLLSQWAQQKKGVVINFSSNAGSSYRIDYVLEAPGSFSIPVVFLYDQMSAYRAGAAANLMHTLPVTCKPVMGYEGLDKRLRQSAF